MNRKKGSAGLSLIELLIVTALLAILLVVTYSVFGATADTFEKNTITGDLETEARQLIHAFENEYNFCRVDNFADTGHTFIVVQIPVDHDNDGDVISNVGAIEYGITNTAKGAMLGWQEAFAFIPTLVIQETGGPGISFSSYPSLEFETVDYDLNRDGDQGDTLVMGNIQRRVYDSTLALQESSTVATRVVLAPASAGNDPALDGDVDGDGNDDMLFNVVDALGASVNSLNINTDGHSIVINIWTGNFTEYGQSFELRNFDRRIPFRNAQ